MTNDINDHHDSRFTALEMAVKHLLSNSPAAVADILKIAETMESFDQAMPPTISPEARQAMAKKSKDVATALRMLAGPPLL